jgi:hypothetical protein
MSIFTILLTVVIAFVCGMVSGIFLGYETATTVHSDNRTCDMCDSKIPDKDALFCSECFEEDNEDRLTIAIKQKEANIRYKDASLRQRTVIDKPSNSELEILQQETKEVDDLCESLERVTIPLRLGINLQPLKDQNKSLETSVKKWQTIKEREDAVDRILHDDF